MRATVVLCALALATPVAAQDANPVGQLVEGYVSCFAGAGDPERAAKLFTDQGWQREDDDEQGLINLTPGAGDATFAYIAQDGSFCHVESMVVDSATASEVLRTVLDKAGVREIDYNKTDEGCTQLAYGDGFTATITSGGQDPMCGSETDSAVRFE